MASDLGFCGLVVAPQRGVARLLHNSRAATRHQCSVATWCGRPSAELNVSLTMASN